MGRRSRVRERLSHNEFLETISSLFTPLGGNWLDGGDLTDIWRRHKDKHSGRPKAVWDAHSRSVVAFLYSEGDDPIGACSVNTFIPFSDAHPAVYFARCLAGVFNADIAICDDYLVTTELWRVLSSHRFERAIARFIGFPTHPSSEWLELMQASLSLTYEGSAVQHTVVFWQKEASAIRFERYYVPFPNVLPLKRALLSEKWVRAVIDGRRAILIENRSGNITGMLSLDALALEEAIDAEALPTFAPHASLLPLQFLTSGPDIALITAPTGDLYVMTGRGVVFHKTQGKWHFIGLEQTLLTLEEYLSRNLSVALIRTLLDLSYERRGALLCVVDKSREVKNLVLDHTQPISNGPLRKALRKLDLLRWADRQIIAAAASTDGATILSADGKVLDVACIISPTVERWKAFGFDQPQTFPGARSTATWNASLFGVAAKVSDDGPIQIWRYGKEIGAIN